METAQILWLLIAYSVGTLVGWWLTYKSRVKKSVEETINMLIQEGFLKTRGEGQSLTIVKLDSKDKSNLKEVENDC